MAEGADGGGSGSSSGSVYRDTNAVPRTTAGTTLYMDLKEGDVAPRVLTVGDPARAARIAEALESVRLRKVSSRDFFTCELRGRGSVHHSNRDGSADGRHLRPRDAADPTGWSGVMVRYGNCGVLQPDVPTGGVVVATEGSVLVQRNPDAFLPPS